MDHLHIPESCKPHARVVPYLGVAPKYDKLGFDGFPERFNLSSDNFSLPHKSVPRRAEWIESFFQEWLWFGLMDEFARACDICLDMSDFIADDPSHGGQVMSTASLYDVYARRVVVRKLHAYALCMGLEKVDLMNLRHDSEEEAIEKINDLKNSKMHDESPIVGSRIGGERILGRPHSGDTANQDGGGEKVPLHVLRDRISACRFILKDGEQGDCLPSLAPGRLKLAACIARAQKRIQSIIVQRDPVVRFEITFSIELLCYTLIKIIEVFLGEHIERHLPVFEQNFITAMMTRNWCPSRITRAVSMGDTILAYIASLLPSFETVSHRGCSRVKCRNRPLAVKAMTGWHRETCGGSCSSVEMEVSRIVKIWKEGGIPGVRRVNSDDGAKFEIEDCTNQPFVAVSHVWSHGLGNPSYNELPSCQVGFLVDSIERIAGGNSLLWIDTLSVPIDSNSTRDAKRAAIAKLHAVYSEASRVLVIDKDLLRVGSDPTERILQLFCSEWMQRLWTLQEGRLARDLFVQFKDGAVSVSSLMTVEPQRQRTPNAEIFDFSETLWAYFAEYFSKETDLITRFLDIVRDMAPRSVTIKTDEPICIATLLDLKPQDFESVDEIYPPTMVGIYRALPGIPQDLMFLDLPRLEVPGLSWAPSTFLESDPSLTSFHISSQLVKLSMEGLHIIKDCLLLDKDLDFSSPCWESSDPRIHLINSPDGQSFAVHSPTSRSLDGLSARIEPSRVISKPAIVWREQGSNLCIRSPAALVSRTREEDGVTYCQFEALLVGWRVNDRDEGLYQISSTSIEVIQTVSANFVVQKSFCVG